MWRGERLAVVLPTYNEAESIRAVVDAFAALGVVDDIVVINNNAHKDTSPNIKGSAAREVFESTQGYGAAIQRGLKETADADLVCICEPDGTFVADDLFKLLPFLTDSDVVLGTRTVQTFIYSGANMNNPMRWGNWIGAKVVELMFNTVSLTDVGCTFRVLRRPTLDKLMPRFHINGSSFGLEMMLLIVRERIPVVQIPVRYLPRVGTSSVTGSPRKTVALAVEMTRLILRHRFRPPTP